MGLFACSFSIVLHLQLKIIIVKQRLTYLLKYSLFWLTFFVFSRVLFLIYNISHTKQLPFIEVLKTFFYGLKLDVSMAGYIIFFASFFMAFLLFFSKTVNIWFFRVYTFFLIFILAVITIVDIELYRNWGFRIDSTVLLYLQTPKESFASTPVVLVIGLFALLGLFIWGSYFFYRKFAEPDLLNLKSVKWYCTPLFLFIASIMIIPIRGGVGIAPINLGAVFFSNHQFANHAAINAIWGVGESLSTMHEKQSIAFMDDTEAENEMAGLFFKKTEKPLTQLINTENPNIIIIIIESFTGGVIEPLGGVPNATPELNRLTNEGVFFTNFYASGDRSDKGIVAILSGYPAQPTTSIIKYTNKTEKLPYLSHKLKKMGYTSGFYYGGEINFANMKSYFISGGYDTLVTLNNFSGNELNSKWGAHDHIVFNRVFNDLEKAQTPFFRAMFTLSSHEPYDVPHKSMFNGTDDESKFLNSVHYTDSCIGNFIKRAKQTKWWDNTWIIFVADHGNRLPGNISYSSPRKFKIPMLWVGGAVNTDTIIANAVSQSDIPLMIGNQLHQKFKGFKFSKDVLNHQKGFAFYAYNNGFGFYTDTTGFVWDNTANNFVINNSVSKKVEKQGKSFMQVLLNDFNRK